MRRSALILGVHQETVAKRMRYLAIQAKISLAKERVESRFDGKLTEHLQMDEMVTSEHTKCKPLNVALGVCGEKYKILGIKISQTPANSKLKEKSERKYTLDSTNSCLNKNSSIFDNFQLEFVENNMNFESNYNVYVSSVLKSLIPISKLDFTKGENNLKNLQLAIELEGASAVVNYNNAVSSLQVQKRNLDLAKNIYTVAK